MCIRKYNAPSQAVNTKEIDANGSDFAVCMSCCNYDVPDIQSRHWAKIVQVCLHWKYFYSVEPELNQRPMDTFIDHFTTTVHRSAN